MKKFFSLSVTVILLVGAAVGQGVLVFKGTIKCYNATDERSTRGAQNVVVVPGFVPGKACLTNPQGYYEMNTAAPMQKLEGKYIMLYYVSSCSNCEIKRNVFVSEDQIRESQNKLSYLTVETVQMRSACKSTELKPMQSDSIYNVFAHLPPQDLDKVSAFNVLTATPGVLNVLTNAIAVATVGGGGNFFADTSTPAKIKYGNFLFASPMNLSANTGFNFSPNRDLSEAVFWNPSALTSSYQSSGIHFLGNFKNNYKFSAYTKLTNKLALGTGGIYTQQDEFRPTAFSGFNSNPVQHDRKLKEYAVYLSPAYAVNDKLSVAVAGKSIWQSFNRPYRMVFPDGSANSFIDSAMKHQRFDADLSVSYRPTRALQIGFNAMNLAGSKLDADALPAQKKLVPVQQLRSFGLGLCYKWKQFNFGTDVLITQNDLYDVSLGVNYIPYNNILLSGGYAFKQQSFSLALRIKYFRLGYVNDNSLLLNDSRKGKSGILNGQLYSGFSFAF